MNKIPNNIDSPLIKIYIFFRTQHLFKKKKFDPYTQKKSQLIRTKHHEWLELNSE